MKDIFKLLRNLHGKPEIWAIDYLSTRAFKHFHYETNFFCYILHNWPINLSRNWKELLNYFKNLFVIASKRKEIWRKNTLNFKLVHSRSACIMKHLRTNQINNFTATSVLLAVCLVSSISIDLFSFFIHSIASDKQQFFFALKYLLLVSSHPEEKTWRPKCDAIPFHGGVISSF